MVFSLGRGDAPSFFTCSSLFTSTSRRQLILFLLLSVLAFSCGATAAEPQLTDNNDNIARGLVGGAVVAS